MLPKALSVDCPRFAGTGEQLPSYHFPIRVNMQIQNVTLGYKRAKGLRTGIGYLLFKREIPSLDLCIE